MKIIEGDIIQLAKEGNFHVIIHGCNCYNTMGAGLAKQIKQQFPNAYLADQQSISGDRSKLGSFTWSEKKHGDNEFIIVNAYTQYDYKDKVNIDYIALSMAFQKINDVFYVPQTKFAYPKIGAGLAGGDWGVISKIIDYHFQNRDHTLVIKE
jgi:O-acetyl-ADP-ribose deacetylase (regulator of RNase III)